MGHWDEIRTQARRKRQELLAGARYDAATMITPEELLGLSQSTTGVPCIPTGAGDPLLYGAEALLYSDGDDRFIYYNADVSPWKAAYYQAHEFAHLWLHHTENAAPCSDIDANEEVTETGLQTGLGRVEGYGPRERREREANVFARELLLPVDELRAWYLSGEYNVDRLAALLELPTSFVFHQLAYALLGYIPDEDEQAPGGPAQIPALDSSQRRAAQVESGPVLVEAGPGTGKTRTLVARIVHLLRAGVQPANILALTFSNKAAEEMRSRVAQVAPEAAPLIQMLTFHAFGLELLSKYGTHAGLPPKLNLADQVDTLFALETGLPQLQLRHYMNLYEPARYLPDILSAISRAKDELVGPEEYARLAAAMLAEATDREDPEQMSDALRALEVARVYSYYTEYLRREGRVDFGDLIFTAVRLLREHHDIREIVRRKYEHVLVDEYQDVNRASGLLLREIVSDGVGLWAVGDARQAIYRFRGAAPRNMRIFGEDFPGAKVLPLEVNYRSQQPVVSLLSEMAPRMRATSGADFTPWLAARGKAQGRVMMNIADDARAEHDGLAGEIKAQRDAGIRYKDQAVLCRSHSVLARIGNALEARGVPVLYLGNLFERPEVRDMLALVSLFCEADGRALVRVASFPEYRVPVSDVVRLRKYATENRHTFPDVLGMGKDAGLSEQGEAGISLLSSHLAKCEHPRNAWELLTRYLFSAGGYLSGLLDDSSVAGRQRRLAIFQLLQFAQESSMRPIPEGAEPMRHFLDYVRRTEMFGDEKAMRQIPDWAGSFDAVRLLTVHASKGLEFSAVYMPQLGNRYFPVSGGGKAECPPPTGMLPEDEADWQDEEEECLFFVALSRARDVLCLSRAKRYGSQSSKASRLFALVEAKLPHPSEGDVTWWADHQEEAEKPETYAPAAPGGRFFAHRLELYLRCPRIYYYEFQLDLVGEGDEASYVLFHRCLYKMLGWLRDEQAAGRPATEEGVLSELERTWQAAGPVGHTHEQLYRTQAEAMLRVVLNRYALSGGRPVRHTWEVKLANGWVTFSPDGAEIENDTGKLKLRHFRTRTNTNDKDTRAHALYMRAAGEKYPGREHQFEGLSLLSGEMDEILLTEKQIGSNLEKFDKAIAGIMQGKFAETPNSRNCPRCPHYFICPA